MGEGDWSREGDKMGEGDKTGEGDYTTGEGADGRGRLERATREGGRD